MVSQYVMNVSVSFHQILDSDVKLSKRDSVSVRVKLTVPMGCLHLAFGDETYCMQPLILFDPQMNNTECAGGLSVTDRYGEKCSEEIKVGFFIRLHLDIYPCFHLFLIWC